MWIELTQKLNSVGLGHKTVDKWQKSWSDYKQNLKKKAAEIDRSRKLTGGGPGSEKMLSEFDLKVLGILGESFYKGVGVEEIGVSNILSIANLLFEQYIINTSEHFRAEKS
ncbi:hypothetical protein NQ318_023500 [Aromia moschata]|uniref:Regulatory protein zeste n=1 Tax=Aromia moschata TaxID=1265417 RepID=A0AAV8YPU7_9CUCU|nr:hypothetical protein NQ318_023500 [Aromia moschata]